MGTGAVNDFDATHAKMVEAVEAAGLRKIQEAMQEDLNAWLENQNN